MKKKKKFKTNRSAHTRAVIPKSRSTVPKNRTIDKNTITLLEGNLPKGSGWEVLLTDHNVGETLFVRTNNNIPTPIQVAQAMALEWNTLTTEEIVKRFTENPIYVSEPHYLWDVLAYLMRNVPAAPTQLVDGELVDLIVANHPLLRQLTWEKHDIRMLDIYIAKQASKKGVTLTQEKKAKYTKGYVEYMRRLPKDLLVMRGIVDGRVVNIEMAELLNRGGAKRYHMAVRGPSLTEETEPYINQWLREDTLFVGKSNIRLRGTLENSRKKPVSIPGKGPMGSYLKNPRYMKRDWDSGERTSDLKNASHEDNVLSAVKALHDNPGMTIRIDDPRRID